MFDLVQNVSIATHQSGTSLDWIITRYDDIILKNQPVACSLVSDHFAVKCEMNPPVLNESRKTISYRKVKDIDLDNFKKDISELSVVKAPPDDLDSLVHEYNKQLGCLFDKHAPIITKNVRNRKVHP